jgi:hypothetical protein
MFAPMGQMASLVDVQYHNDPALPYVVRQLLSLTGGQYEQERAARCALNWRYYHNTQYEREFLEATTVEGTVRATSREPGAELQARKELWHGIQPLFTVASTAVNVDQQLLWKGARPQPVEFDPDLEARLTEKWERERWSRIVQRAGLFGAIMGHSYFRVIPGELDGLPGRPSRLHVHSPEEMTVLRDQHHNHRVVAARIEYLYEEDVEEARSRNKMQGRADQRVGALGGPSGLASWVADGIQGAWRSAVGVERTTEFHVYTMIITEEEYFTFRDHRPYAWWDMGARWDNSLGVVPVVEIPFIDIGTDMGLPTFANILPTIDTVSELLSMFANVLKIYGDPVGMAINVKKSALEKMLAANGASWWFVPPAINYGTNTQAPQPDFRFIEPQFSSAPSLLQYVNKVTSDAEAAMPEAGYKRAEDRAGSGYEARLDMMPMEDKALAFRGTHYAALEDALQMALVADDVSKEGGRVSPDEVRERIEAAREKYDMTIYADPVIPRDRSTESQIISSKYADGLITKRKARLLDGLTYRQVLDEEAQEKREFTEMMRMQREWLEMHAQMGMKAPAMPQGSAGRGMTAGTRPTAQTQPGQGISAANSRTAGQPNSRSGNPRGE